MKRGVWLSGLVLSLSGWVARLDAQDRAVNPTGEQMTPIAWTGSELQPCPVPPAAALGRPVVIATSRPVPPATSGVLAVTPISYQTPADPVVQPAPAKGNQPPLPTWNDEAEQALDPSGLIEQVSLFASDRGTPAPADRSGIVPVSGEPELIQIPKGTTVIVPARPPVELVPASAGAPAVDGPVPDPLHQHFWVKAEYLLWGIKSYHIPVLASTGDTTNLGILGQNGTTTLFGDTNLDGGLRSGLRISAGTWLDMWQEEGVELSGFYLGDKNNGFSTNTAQNPIISRPFFDLNRNRENVELVSFPGLQTGSLSVNTPSNFFGMEADYRAKLCCGCDYRIDLLAGIRFLDLDEDLRITEDIQFGNSPLLGNLANQHGIGVDDFHTKNRFYGAQAGIAGEKSWGAWSVGGQFKLALGVNSEDIIINGSQTFTPNSALNARGDLLALPSNIGSHERSVFSAVPEIDLNVGYRFNEHVRAFVGYNFLYWSSVVRPGDQIDRVLDVTTIPNFQLPPGVAPTGMNRPAVPFKESGFWAQGFNAGIEFRY